MSSKSKHVEEEEEEEEEEDSEPVVILKNRKGSIKIVTDLNESNASVPATAPVRPVSPAAVIKDLSQPLQVAVPSGQEVGASSASPAKPAVASPRSPKGAQQQNNPSPKSPAMMSPSGQKVSGNPSTASPVQQHTPVPAPMSPPQPAAAQMRQQPVSSVSPLQPVAQARQPVPQPQAQPVVSPAPVPQKVEQPAAVSPGAGGQPLAATWSPQASPVAEGGAHPVLKQVPLKPAGPLVYPEPVVLHPTATNEGPVSVPPVEILDDFAWRHTDESQTTLMTKPERVPTKLGKVWPPIQESAQVEKASFTGVHVQAPESWVQQESVSAVHALAAAPWARKETPARISSQWPPPENEVQRYEVRSERSLKPQWPPVAEEAVPSSQMYQRIALQQVHSQVAKQQTYFNSGGQIKPEYDDVEMAPPVAPVQVQQQAPAPIVQQPVPPKPALRPGQIGHPQSGQPQPVAQPQQKVSQGHAPGQHNIRFQQQAPAQQVAQQPQAVQPVQVQLAAYQKFGTKGAQFAQQQQPTGVYQNGQAPITRPKFVR